VRGGTTENEVVSDGKQKDEFYRKQLLFSFKKVNKLSAYSVGKNGNKEKYEKRYTTVNVWI
jgi:hypothetical protein